MICEKHFYESPEEWPQLPCPICYTRPVIFVAVDPPMPLWDGQEAIEISTEHSSYREARFEKRTFKARGEDVAASTIGFAWVKR